MKCQMREVNQATKLKLTPSLSLSLLKKRKRTLDMFFFWMVVEWW